MEGTYQYWIELASPSPARDLTVVLPNSNNDEVRSWDSPANPSSIDQRGWHVFDLNGAVGSVKSINKVIKETVPEVHEPNHDVCPF